MRAGIHICFPRGSVCKYVSNLVMWKKYPGSINKWQKWPWPWSANATNNWEYWWTLVDQLYSGYPEITGNEKANECAKHGSLTSYIGSTRSGNGNNYYCYDFCLDTGQELSDK